MSGINTIFMIYFFGGGGGGGGMILMCTVSYSGDNPSVNNLIIIMSW